MTARAWGHKLPQAVVGVGQTQVGTIVLLKHALRFSVAWNYLELEKMVVVKSEKIQECAPTNR